MNKIAEMKALIKTLNEASDAYYNGASESTLTDEQFDRMMYHLNSLEQDTGIIFSDSPTHNVGAKVVDSINKVEHNHLMLSLDKCHSAQELIDFAEDDDCYLSVKCDGLTCSLRYIDGQLVSAETRGDGYVGQSILFHAIEFCNIPTYIPYDGEFIIDGEAVIFTDDFEKINSTLPEDKKFKNSRNLASGTLANLDASITRQRNLRFVAWRVIKGFEYIPSNFFKLKEAEKFGFTLPPMFTYTNKSSDKDNLEDILHMLRKQANDIGLPMDGVVMAKDNCELADRMGRTDKFFYHSIAYKFEDEMYETFLTGIDWTVGRTGIITPTALFRPTIIDGTEVSRASMHNLSVMKELSGGNVFYQNMKINIYKANQIIPQVKSVEYAFEDEINNKTLPAPKECPCCGAATSIVKTNNSEVLMCTNPNCSAKKIAQFTHFVSRKAMNIDGLSEKTLELLISHGFLHNYKDIYHLKEHRDKLILLDGLGTKSVDKLLDSIEKSRDVTLDRFLVALGVSNIGSSASKTIAQKFNGSYVDFVNAIGRQFDFTALYDFGETMNDSIYNWFEDNKEDMHNLAKELYFDTFESTTVSDNPFAGKTLVVTGKLNYFTRDSINEKIASLGAKTAGSVSKKTDFLITNEASGSSKYKKAMELGIPIISEEEFLSML